MSHHEPHYDRALDRARPPDRGLAEQVRRRNRALLLVGLVGLTIAAVVFFAAGAVLSGLCSTLAGLATVVAAGRHARPANWTPEDRDHENR